MSSLKEKLAAKLAAASSPGAVTVAATKPVTVVQVTAKEMKLLEKDKGGKIAEAIKAASTAVTTAAVKDLGPARVVFADTDNQTLADIRFQMADLQEKLIANIPDFPVILKSIHEKLRKDPAVVTLMSEDEIKLVVQGLAKHAQVEVVSPTALKQAKSAARKGAVSAEML